MRGKSLSIFLSSVYHPCHDIPHEQFIETLNSLLHTVPRNTHIIIGADINAKIGRRDTDDLNAVLGPHGPLRRNTRGVGTLKDGYVRRVPLPRVSAAPGRTAPGTAPGRAAPGRAAPVLKDGYIRRVPLPRVSTLKQSTLGGSGRDHPSEIRTL